MECTDFKPAGGIAAAAVVPAGAAACGTPAQAAAAALPLPLVDDRSFYEERTDASSGIALIEHRLSLVIPREYAATLLEGDTAALWSACGTAAVVDTVSGERLTVGCSERFGAQQPLRLVSVDFTTGDSPRTVPAATLLFTSFDTSPAARSRTPAAHQMKNPQQ